MLLLFLWLLPLLTGCGDSEDPSDLKPHKENSDPPKPPQNAISDHPNAYYPFVYGMKISAGDGYINVTIDGAVFAIGDFISEVQVIKFRHQIILIPIAQPSPTGPSPALIDPFQETVQIENLEKGSYGITIIGVDDAIGERSLITEIAEVK
jgi:hypothetical protein